ncbi:hypothetical protein [Nocardiopsis sp. FR26]|uniref:hypothetical protein n=1 Tax=Nocardiopsis sp. FR26 TaxID=2605987 RepID=UPI0013593A41|nr:hypothetical protein [Nocardiopsis sp. FR26]
MNKTRWIWAGLTAVTILAALTTGLCFGGGPTTRNRWEADSRAAAFTGTLGLAVNVFAWAATKTPLTPPQPQGTARAR